MADNYLEKKMEEYRSGVLSRPYARRVSLTGSRPGTVSFKIDPLRVLVTDASDDVGRAVVTRLREAGCRVAFACADDKAGRALSHHLIFFYINYLRCRHIIRKDGIRKPGELLRGIAYIELIRRSPL